MIDYEPGNVLRVRFTPHNRSAVADRNVPGQINLSLEIVKPFHPFTMSAAMQVEVLSTTSDRDTLGGRTSFLLELYDRRAAPNMRNQQDGREAYVPEREADYQAYPTDPSRPPVEYSNWGPPDSDDELARKAPIEEWLGWSCHQMYADELAVYRNLMKGAQTTQRAAGVPQFFGRVQLDSPIGTINGILIEHVSPSITLEKFVLSRGSCGRFDAQVTSVFEMALSALDSCHDDQVINRDVKAFNVLVRLSCRKLTEIPEV